jgi:hypothetical protein
VSAPILLSQDRVHRSTLTGVGWSNRCNSVNRSITDLFAVLPLGCVRAMASLL